jgi:ABC-type transport system involved in cytochrome c biogenesis permease subunit
MERASVIFLWSAFLLYGAAFVVFLYHLFSKRPAMNRAGMVLAAVGLVFHTAALICRGISAGHVPVVGVYESLVLVAWSVTLVYHVLESFTRIKAVGLYVMPVVLILLTTAWSDYRAPVGLMPALRSDVVVVHVIVMLVAVGCLYVAGGAALIYVIERDQLKRRRVGLLLGRLPSLGTLDKLVYHATLLGLPFLTMGMVAGVIRAVTYHVPQWWGDPLVLLALAAWCVYAVLLWGRMRRGWGGSRASWLAIVGLVVLLVIRFVAVPYLSDFHTWGG